jgi:hypothetical protein
VRTPPRWAAGVVYEALLAAARNEALCEAVAVDQCAA